jgi:hypothetical protein
METFKMLKVYFGEQTMGKTQVFGWFSIFKKRMTSAEDAKCSICPSTSKKLKKKN